MLTINVADFIREPEFWVAVAFFGFVGLLVWFKVPGLLAKALDDRAEGIRTELDEARRLRDDARKLLEDYKQKRLEAETEAKSIIDQARREAENLAEETRKGLNEMLERRTKLAEEKIARAETQAMAEVRSVAVDTAMAASERLLKDKVAGAAGSALIDDGIRELKGKLN